MKFGKLKFTQYEIRSFIEYLDDKYGKLYPNIVDEFVAALTLGVSDIAHYDYFLEMIHNARERK